MSQWDQFVRFAPSIPSLAAVVIGLASPSVQVAAGVAVLVAVAVAYLGWLFGVTVVPIGEAAEMIGRFVGVAMIAAVAYGIKRAFQFAWRKFARTGQT